MRWINHLYDISHADPHLPDEWAVEARQHADAASWFRSLVATHFRGTVRGPFNDGARAQAGFDKSWYEPLAEVWSTLPKKEARRDRAADGVGGGGGGSRQVSV